MKKANFLELEGSTLEAAAGWVLECINEIANGEPIQADDYDIFCHRMAQFYLEDPVNNGHLWRYAM